MRQLTLCFSSTYSLEPSPNLVPPEVPASGHHGFVRWGHDEKTTKNGVIPRVACLARARPMTHRIGGRTWDLYLSPQRAVGSRLLVGIEIWGRQLTTRGVKLGSQKGVIFAAQNEPKIRDTPNGISPRRLGDRIRHSICNPSGVQPRLPCTWLSKISMPVGVVTISMGSTNAKMAKLSTLTLG